MRKVRVAWAPCSSLSLSSLSFGVGCGDGERDRKMEGGRTRAAGHRDNKGREQKAGWHRNELSLRRVESRSRGLTHVELSRCDHVTVSVCSPHATSLFFLLPSPLRFRWIHSSVNLLAQVTSPEDMFVLHHTRGLDPALGAHSL